MTKKLNFLTTFKAQNRDYVIHLNFVRDESLTNLDQLEAYFFGRLLDHNYQRVIEQHRSLDKSG